MSQTVPLSASAQVVLNGSGNGSVTLGPQVPGQTWFPSGTSVQVNPTSTTVVSQFKLYNGAAQPANFLGGTYTGDNNSDGLADCTLYCGQFMTGVWAGGNPGATATLVVSGTMSIP